VLASLVAGLATTPFVAFHFHRLAPYGVLANLLAMPVVSAWVMPMGILGVLAMPFGFDAPFWHAMGWGIDWMIAIAQWVSGLPGAVGRIAAFGTGPLLLAAAGLLLICLLRTKLRWSGAGLAAIAGLWIALTGQPDAYVSNDGQAAAIRTNTGKLSILHRGRDAFAVREWLAADADGRPIDDKSLTSSVRCDEIGCVGRLRDGKLVAMPLSTDAFGDDCARASLVVSPRQVPGDCRAVLLDRKSLREYGAASVQVRGDQLQITRARPRGYERPWSRQAQHTQSDRRLNDGTPPINNLEADD
jgi:competence protein ComEC